MQGKRIPNALIVTLSLVISILVSSVTAANAVAEVIGGCDWTRTEGINATDTAAKCALAAFERSETVVLVSTASPAESVVGLGLAGALDCALLSSDPVIFTDSVSLALRSLGAKQVILCATPETLTAPIEEGVRSLGIHVERLEGTTAAEVSLAAFKRIRSTKPVSAATVVVSEADGQAATSLGAWAYKSASPVLVSDVQGRLTDAEVAAIHADPGISRVLLAGSADSLSDAIFDQVGAIYHTTRLFAGGARESAALSALWTADGGLCWVEPVVASLTSPADCVAAALLAGRRSAVLILTEGSTDDAVRLTRAYGAKPERATLVGAPSVLAAPSGTEPFTFDLTPKESAIVAAAASEVFPGPSLCALWVSNVYESAGYARPYGDARDLYRTYCSSSDLYELRPGMIIGVPRHPHTEAGSIYGHVAIYLGYGMVRQSGTEVVRELSLAEWIAHYGETVTPAWGFAL